MSGGDDDHVIVRRSELDAVLARLDALERHVGVASVDTGPAVAPTLAPPPRPSRPAGVVGRRRALAGLAGAAVTAGAAAVATTSTPAAADNGSALVIGSAANVGTLPTLLTVNDQSADYGIAVGDNGGVTPVSFPAVEGHARNSCFFLGVYGRGENGADGVFGEAVGAGVDLGIGVKAAGPDQMHLVPNERPSPPTDTLEGRAGSLRWTAAGGSLWACTGNGTPGTWRKIVGTGTAGAFHLLPTPKRAYDSRPSTTPSQGPKTPLTTTARIIDLKHNGTGVPVGATGVLLTVLLVNAAAAAGNMTIWAASRDKPQANTMVWGGSAGRFTGMAMTAVDGQGRVRIDASASTHVVLDVVGYFR